MKFFFEYLQYNFEKFELKTSGNSYLSYRIIDSFQRILILIYFEAFCNMILYIFFQYG